MVNPPLISIIVPVFNTEAYLQECIESILKQDFSNFELLLINDGSTDGSLAICLDAASSDSRIRVISNQNQGVSATRAQGVEESQGDWIVFVDADDTISINHLSLLYQTASLHDCDLVKAAIANSSGKKWMHRCTEPMDREAYLQSVLNDTTYSYLYSSIYRKTLFDTSTFPKDASLKIGEDVLTSLLLAKKLNKAININDVIYSYRTNDNSVMCQRIPHPDYWMRYYQQTLLLLEGQECLSPDIRAQLERLSLVRQIKAFLEPEVPFDKQTFNKIRQQIITLEGSSGFKPKYGTSLRHTSSALLLKLFKRAHLQLKGISKFGHLYKRQLLH